MLITDEYRRCISLVIGSVLVLIIARYCSTSDKIGTDYVYCYNIMFGEREILVNFSFKAVQVCKTALGCFFYQSCF